MDDLRQQVRPLRRLIRPAPEPAPPCPPHRLEERSAVADHPIKLARLITFDRVAPVEVPARDGETTVLAFMGAGSGVETGAPYDQRYLPIAAGMTIRTGKSGQDIYYACNAKLCAGAGRCEARAIRQDELDASVLLVLSDRILQRDRLIERLRAVLETSDAADMQRQQDRDRVRRETVAAETRVRRLIEMVGDGHMSPKDTNFAERLAQRRQNLAQREAEERSLGPQLERGPQRISQDTVTNSAS